MKLTEPAVRLLRAPTDKREALYFDDALPGFGVRMYSSGKASYFVKYTMPGGKQRNVSLGAVIPGILKKKRIEAADIKSKARNGTDTSAERKAARAVKVVTLGEIVPLYLAAKQKELRPSTYAATCRYLTGHLSALATVPIDGISRKQLAHQIDNIVAEHGAVAADRAKAAISGLFAWAIERGHLETNPANDIAQRASGDSRTRVLCDAELAAIWRECGDGEYAAIVRLLILTAQRKMEISGLSWGEIDFKDAKIDLPPHRVKNGLPHVVPCAPLAMEIICAVPVREGRELLFGFGVGGFQGWSKSKRTLDARLPEKMQPWVIHDIRRSVATHLAERGFAQPHVVEAILNHVSGSKRAVAGVYNRAVYMAERREALNRWAEHVAALGGVRP